MIKKQKRKYAVNPSLSLDRTGNRERRDSILKSWQATTESIGACSGDVKMEFWFDEVSQSFTFKEATFDEVYDYGMAYIISSPFLLYRLISTFSAAPKVPNKPYKSIWEITLKHSSGKLIMFSEWKGACGFWLTDRSHREMNEEFKSDLISLMNYLVSDECLHPYDGLVAGSIA